MASQSPDNAQKSMLLPRMALIDVERAVMDLRRGLPVVIEGDDAQAGSVLAAASELIDAETLAFMETVTGSKPTLHLTQRRAETLNIRVASARGVTVLLPEPENRGAARPLSQIAHLSDPARDLEFPLQGPFVASSEPLNDAQAASLQLAKFAGLLPATLTAPLKSKSNKAANTANLIHVSADAIASFEAAQAADLAAAGHLQARLKPVIDAKIPLADAPPEQPDSHVYAFRPHGPGGGGPEHLAIVIGTIDTARPVLVRLHSECFTGDLLGSLKCDCGEQLRGAIAEIAEAGSGILLYLAQEGRGIGLMNKLRAYQLQDQGFDTVEANLRLGFEVDERLFKAAAEMLRQLGVTSVRLMTNNPDKQDQLTKCGVTITERVPHAFEANSHNARYLATKAGKTGHLL